MSKRSVDFKMEDSAEGCLIESADGRSDQEVLKRYAKIGEVVCDIANHGDDAEVRRKGDGSYAIYAVKKNKVTVFIHKDRFYI